MTIEDAANHLALSPYTVKKMLRNGQLDFVQINSRVKRISTTALQKFINNKKRGEWFGFCDDEIEDVVHQMKNYREEDDISIEAWRDFYEKHIRNSKSTDYKMEYFIELAICEIILNNNDTAIQRLIEFQELLFSRNRMIGMPKLTDKILNTK